MLLYRRYPEHSHTLQDATTNPVYTRPIGLPAHYRLIHLTGPEDLDIGDYIVGRLVPLSQRHPDEVVTGLVVGVNAPRAIIAPQSGDVKELHRILLLSEGERRTHDFVADIYRPDRWLALLDQKLLAQAAPVLVNCPQCADDKHEHKHKCCECQKSFCSFACFVRACERGEHQPCRTG
jgi:hypothetical protein